ncbi:alpha/beta fold hydrolase [Chlorobium phaeobacteroides]|uniref:Alpha/beta hydrolase fold protein n=1 Tax=Chlorobium phaeobacteroides (strain DSM 266 / SMG 266 / 2430) TaxID=290317 RepID=A1BGY1_CHLPD|nr:alpha/beta hydrolase [Chlorobium phaeobacteroides]ABL65658.1 alpha/beta hydrolase fold protein [Chlorobium phaeobacteroides DSM 266]MBV5328377.1 alpha/beta hydrolase [Chlorobium sp.]
MATRNKYITTGGHRHRYIETGSASETMLLLHGISSSLDFYEQVIPELSKSFRVLAFDFLGFGLSEKPLNKTYSLELYADLINEFLEKTDSHGPSLYATGHSMGGKYLLASALLYPQTYRKLVLSNTDGFLYVPSWARAISLPGVKQVLKNVVTREKLSEKMFAAAFYRPDQVNRDSFMKNLMVARNPEAFDTVMSLNRNMKQLDMNRTGLRGRLNELKIPVLVIWGDKDQYISPKTAKSVQNELPCSKLVIFSDCGHSPMLEYPEKFSTTIREFIFSETHFPGNQCS